MTILLSRIAPRDLESAVLSYQQAVHRHQFAQQPQLLDVTLEELLAALHFSSNRQPGQSIASRIAVTVSRVSPTRPP